MYILDVTGEKSKLSKEEITKYLELTEKNIKKWMKIAKKCKKTPNEIMIIIGTDYLVNGKHPESKTKKRINSFDPRTKNILLKAKKELKNRLIYLPADFKGELDKLLEKRGMKINNKTALEYFGEYGSQCGEYLANMLKEKFSLEKIYYRREASIHSSEDLRAEEHLKKRRLRSWLKKVSFKRRF